MVRLFVAIDLSDEVRERLSSSQEELKKSMARITLVDPRIIHITLKFIGEVPDRTADRIALALRGIPRRDPFEIIVRGVGGNNPRQPRVIWCIIEDEGRCRGLNAAVEDLLVPLGIPKEKRPFRPHATIARVKEFHPSLLESMKPLRDRDFGSCMVRDIRLKKSTLTPAGPVYEDILEVPL